MNNNTRQLVVRIRAFTLIELLVVISIIALLAAIIIPAAGNMARKQRLTRAKAELDQIETAIEAYKAARGHYPPDNPNNATRPQLFYELTGTVYRETSPPRTFKRINGIESIVTGTVQSTFGTDGFVNTSHVQDPSNAGQMREAEAKDFFLSIKPGQYMTNDNFVAFLGVPVDGPDEITNADGKRINPWCYNSSSPTNNPDSFDLWVDIKLKSKINRVCNWSDVPVILN